MASVNEHLEFEVRDEGFGISEDDQKEMFTAFYRVHTADTKSIEGTGLGLVIAKGIVEIHGGQMEMDSTLGEGTSFKFQIHDLNNVQPSGESDHNDSAELAA